MKRATILGVIMLLMGTAVAGQAASAGSGATPASAKDSTYPYRPIRLIVPFPAGGPSDLVARMIADKLSKDLNQNVVVFNKPGAGSAVGLQMLAASEADGYTIGLATSSLITNRYASLAPVSYTNLAPLVLMLNSPGALVVKTGAPWKNISEFMNDARAKRKNLRVGNTGTGATWHLMGLIMREKLTINFTDVPYRGGAPLTVAVMSEEVQAGLQSVSGWAPNVKAGRIRVLGVAADQRDPALPDALTFREQGVDLVYGLWTGFLAPKGTPNGIVKKLSDTLVIISKDSHFLEFAKKNAFNVEVKGPSDFEKFLKAEDIRVSELAKKYDFVAK